MPSGKSKRKLKLFGQGVANLSNIVACPTDAYLCPLCGNFKSLNELTLEHAPPKSIGGKEIILTCYTCNNDAGRKIDSHIAKQQNMNRLAKSLAIQTFQQKERGIISVNGTELRVEIEKKSDNSPLNISIVKKANNPLIIQKIKDVAQNVAASGKPFTFQIKSEPQYNYSEELAKVGHLKSAFLIAVAAIGYSYAFNNNLNAIRTHINEPSETIADFYLEYYNGNPHDNSLLEVTTLGVIIVSFYGIRVVLPHPQRCFKDYLNTINAIKNGMLPTITGNIIPWPDNFIALLDNSDDIVFSIIEN